MLPDLLVSSRLRISLSISEDPYLLIGTLKTSRDPWLCHKRLSSEFGVEQIPAAHQLKIRFYVYQGYRHLSCVKLYFAPKETGAGQLEGGPGKVTGMGQLPATPRALSEKVCTLFRETPLRSNEMSYRSTPRMRSETAFDSLTRATNGVQTGAPPPIRGGRLEGTGMD